jgi:peptidoglycan/LPS O-acetylase OafA/YrhL
MATERERSVTGFAYHPALDGVRAVAVLAVLLFHGGVGFLPGGFLGVDAFFVLSGFLITSLLLAEYFGARACRAPIGSSTGRIRLAAFWARRARRLLPALLVVVVFVLATYRLLVPSNEAGLLRGDALSTLGYVANWRMIYRGDNYFTVSSNPSPLQHAWSLGIEEQFYLVWPLLLTAFFFLWRGTRRLAALAVACAVGVAASAVAAAFEFRPLDVNRAYFGTDSRAQALLVGCALAVVLARWSPPVRLFVVLAGIGILIDAWIWTHAHGTDGWLFRGGLLVDALGVAAVLGLVTLRPSSAVGRVLAIAPLVWLGRISYGVYLWHWPLYALLSAGRTGLTGLALLMVRIAVTIGVAIVSYVVIEQPIRTGRGWPTALPSVLKRRPVAALTAVASVAGVGVFAVVATASGPGRSVAPVYALPSAPPAASSVAKIAPVNRPGRRPGGPRITFFGDSVSWSLGTYLPPHPGLDVTVRALPGCGIARLPDLLQLGTGGTNYPGCTQWDAKWRAGVKADDPDVSVILLDRWELMTRKLNGRYQAVGDPEYDQYLTGELNEAISIAGSGGAPVVLLTAPYTHRAEKPDGGLYDEDQPARVDAWNKLLYAEAARQPHNVSVIDLNARVCPDHRFTWSIGDLQIRSDGLHFTPEGVQQWVAPWLLPQLATVAVTPRLVSHR